MIKKLCFCLTRHSTFFVGPGVQQSTQNSSVASTSQTALLQGTSGGSAVVVATTQVVVSQTPVVITTTAPTVTSTPGGSPSKILEVFTIRI